MNKTIFITGSSGLIGSHFIKKFDAHYKIYRLSNNKKLRNNKDYVYLNYLDKKEIQSLINQLGVPDYFLHFGWGKMESPHSEYHLKENIQCAKNLLQMFSKKGLKKFIFLGSINEYGKSLNNYPFKESQKKSYDLRNYERGKIKFSKYALRYVGNKKTTYIHIRLCNIFGLIKKKESLIYSIHASFKLKKNLRVSSLDNYRDLLYVDDATRGIKEIMINVGSSKIINLGSGQSILMKDFVKIYWQLLGGSEAKIKFGNIKNSKKNTKQTLNHMDITLLKKNINWKKPFNIKKNIKRNIKAYKTIYRSIK